MATDKSYKRSGAQRLLPVEAGFARVQRMASIGCWELDLADLEDANANELRWSEGVFAVFGYRPGEVEVTNELFFSAVPAEERQRVRDAVQQALKTGRAYCLEHRIRRPDGAVRVVREHADVVRDPESGRPLMLFGTVQDVTDHDSALRALRESESRFRATFHQAAVGMAHVGLDGSWLRVNDKLCEIVGCTPEELQKLPVLELAHPDDADEVSRLARQALQTRSKAVCLERRLVRRGGEVVWVQLTVSLMRDGPGEPEYFMAVVEDVTQRHEAQDELARLNAELEARVRRRTDALRRALADLESFSYTVSHDLRGPLRAMQGYAELLLQKLGGKMPEESECMIRRIAASASRMDRLTQDVLTFSRLSRQDVPLVRVELDALVAALVEHYPDWKGAGLAVRRPLGCVMANESLLSQAIANLVGNALRFGAQGGSPAVELSSERGGGVLRLSVRDNGIGIDPADQDRIFQPFVRLGAGGCGEGTGIGLAIVKKAVERMGGRVGVDSKPGEGSRFWLELAEAA